MTDFNRAINEGPDRTPLVHKSALARRGLIFESLDFVAGIVAAVMILGPLAMAAFWAPYH
jgi:hypothetical protein